MEGIGGVELLDADVRTARFDDHLLADVVVETVPDMQEEVRRALPGVLGERLGASTTTVDVDLTVHVAENVP